jgi:nitrogen fixation-related uncharacterized protein
MFVLISAVLISVAALLFAGSALVWWAFSDNRQYDLEQNPSRSN